MKIADVEPIIVDAGWQTWIFVKVTTDEQIVGWGECSQPRAPLAVAAAVRDFKRIITGKDPRSFEMRFWDMERLAIQGWSGVRAMALAGIELALLDIKAKALGISVIELFGGPTRDRVRVYWSHCGTTRASYPQLGKPPIQTMDDITNLGQEVVRRGYTALKTNIIFPGDPATVYRNGFQGGLGTTDQVVSKTMLNHIDTLIGTFRNAVGPDVDICLDLNFNFKPESCKRIAQVLEQYELLWLEVDMYDPKAILEIKQSTTTKICTGENLIYMREYLPYFRCRAADVFMIDVPWNGFSQSKKIGDLAQVFEFNVAPHNYYSHLSTFISASLCGVLPNVRIMETDVDALPIKDELVTNVPKIVNGYMKMPTAPGWGTTIVEDVARAHSWK
ncbi:MAG: mandelate racemase/muconate lactonizing enzyme family protein [Candidatus Bathyarchaeota archaeon]|nr:mandelate racemase/muconate lactonizing enzyme family protein [Candidatus Bathyarchaeota archaeon]